MIQESSIKKLIKFFSNFNLFNKMVARQHKKNIKKFNKIAHKKICISMINAKHHQRILKTYLSIGEQEKLRKLNRFARKATKQYHLKAPIISLYGSQEAFCYPEANPSLILIGFETLNFSLNELKVIISHEIGHIISYQILHKQPFFEIIKTRAINQCAIKMIIILSYVLTTIISIFLALISISAYIFISNYTHSCFTTNSILLLSLIISTGTYSIVLINYRDTCINKIKHISDKEKNQQYGKNEETADKIGTKIFPHPILLAHTLTKIFRLNNLHADIREREPLGKKVLYSPFLKDRIRKLKHQGNQNE